MTTYTLTLTGILVVENMIKTCFDTVLGPTAFIISIYLTKCLPNRNSVLLRNAEVMQQIQVFKYAFPFDCEAEKKTNHLFS